MPDSAVNSETSNPLLTAPKHVIDYMNELVSDHSHHEAKAPSRKDADALPQQIE
ncbi:MAG: hypothetical protein LKF45_04005 [Bifidobacterium tibiigranuli]|jgi:hypothetical protein|nr:hypothetical protein [Bifidobacterium tibiigranuli]